MDRIATGIMIAIAALAMAGGIGGKALAAERPADRSDALSTPVPLAESSGGRVLSLLVALEALRTVPEVLDNPKV